jgi:Skp family chaperone for outer membrane proteins
MSLTLFVALGLLIVTVFGLIFYVTSKQNIAILHKKSEQDSQTLATLTSQIAVIQDELHEMRSGNHAMSKKLKTLVTELQSLSDKQEQLAEQDPQSRFYQSAAKLIASGASLEQVIQECDIPRAEAELLFSLHQRQ